MCFDSSLFLCYAQGSFLKRRIKGKTIKEFTAKGGKRMPKQIVLEFPVELPEGGLKDKEVLKKGKAIIILELLRKRGYISGESSRASGDRPAYPC